MGIWDFVGIGWVTLEAHSADRGMCGGESSAGQVSGFVQEVLGCAVHGFRLICVF